jgi:putative endonuclease
MNYEVIIQNYRCRQGEIDIIATKDCELIFVEVRSLSGNQDPLRAIASVNKHKQKRMLVAANHYLSQFPPSPLINIRFDVIGISFHADLSMTCHHLPNAIQSC